MVTRSDVAQRAGTSAAVVSYVVNNGPRNVAPATKARVQQAIDELGYRPNALARALRMARTDTVGLILPDMSNPYFAELARSIEEETFAAGMTLLIGNASDDDQRELAYLRTFVDRQVDAAIVIATSESWHLQEELRRLALPLVLLDRRVTDVVRPAVLTDNIGGAAEVVRHLREHGHRHIVCLAGQPVMTNTDRVRGFHVVMEDTPSAGHVVRGDFGIRGGYEAFDMIMRLQPPPTAVFAVNDAQALGLMRAAHEKGIRVPDDLAVAGYDGISWGTVSSPGLTTMRQPLAGMAARAMGLVRSELLGRPAPPREHVVPGVLIRRGSCGCADSQPDWLAD